MFTAPSNPLHLVFPPLPSPTILHLRVGRAPSCASNNRVETPCGSRQRLPHPSRNEQRAISLLLNACHKSPRAPSTPPLPSTSPPSRHSPSLFLLFLHPCLSPLNVLPSLHAPLPKLSFLPSFPPRYTRFFSSSTLSLLSPLEEVFGKRGREGGTGTRNVHFCGSYLRLR